VSLQNWLSEGLLVAHQTNPREIAELLNMVRQDLSQCRTPGLSPDWSLNIAYSGVLQAASVALAAAGYRAPAGEGHHYVVLQSLAHTVGVDSSAVRKLDALRKRRHIATYTRTGTVSDREARDAIALIDQVCVDVKTWLKENHPGLLTD
jgi:hypothetical protein